MQLHKTKTVLIHFASRGLKRLEDLNPAKNYSVVITVPFEITNFGDTDRGHALSQIQLGRVLDTAYDTTAHYKFLVDHAIDMKIIRKHDSVSSIEYDVEFKISKKHDTYYRLRYE